MSIKQLNEFNNYCKSKNIECIAHPIGKNLCLVITPIFSRKFTLEAIKYIDDVLVSVKVNR